MRPALRLLARRLPVSALLLLAVSLAVFGLLALSPGSTERALLGPRPATAEALDAIRHRYHLDQPFLVQYGHWLGGVLRGDMGVSVQTGEPVAARIAERLSITLELGLYATLLIVLLGVPLGLLAAARRDGAADHAVSAGAVLAVSAPSFAVGVLLLYVFGVRLGWFPVFGAGEEGWDRVRHLTLPAVALALSQIALVTRQTRAAAIDVVSRDHLTFARARGLPGRVIWRRYALRNTAVPVTTSVGLVLAYAMTGAVLVEVTFSLPGVGALVMESVSNKDVPVVQGVALSAAAAVIAVNLLVDLAYLALDPRLRQAAS
ncbi:ABC transporter permease [Nonomuraea pusilla]|uniref:Peptide/nickel transport system permease protein n=1 Tax=Nonomuraea pusilla TaxID=46177 RepID=A0A1H7YB20_9ACTN|nr:ABC transporter permease [Nonomuraea pusilla]SEM42517.1 peptide/nickel transport system permease protein [Nonomuraea pusilla]